MKVSLKNACNDVLCLVKSCVVLVPPWWVVEPVDQNVVLGNPTTLKCEVDGFPKPTIVWKRVTGKYLIFRLVNFSNKYVSLVSYQDKAYIRIPSFAAGSHSYNNKVNSNNNSYNNKAIVRNSC